jgi:hypothetical protein
VVDELGEDFSQKEVVEALQQAIEQARGVGGGRRD